MGTIESTDILFIHLNLWWFLYFYHYIIKWKKRCFLILFTLLKLQMSLYYIHFSINLWISFVIATFVIQTSYLVCSKWKSRFYSMIYYFHMINRKVEQNGQIFWKSRFPSLRQDQLYDCAKLDEIFFMSNPLGTYNQDFCIVHFLYLVNK